MGSEDMDNRFYNDRDTELDLRDFDRLSPEDCRSFEDIGLDQALNEIQEETGNFLRRDDAGTQPKDEETEFMYFRRPKDNTKNVGNEIASSSKSTQGQEHSETNESNPDSPRQYPSQNDYSLLPYKKRGAGRILLIAAEWLFYVASALFLIAWFAGAAGIGVNTWWGSVLAEMQAYTIPGLICILLIFFLIMVYKFSRRKKGQQEKISANRY